MEVFVTHDPVPTSPLPTQATADAASMLSISLHEVCRSVVFSGNQITTKKSTFHYYLLPTDFTWCADKRLPFARRRRGCSMQ